MMAVLAAPSNRSYFQIGGYLNYLELPIKTRNAMIEQINRWRFVEDTGKKSAAS